MLIPPGTAQVVADASAPPEPATELTPEEREAFMETWLGVLSRGTVALNETPTDYNYDGALMQELTNELIARLKLEAPEIARQFDPAVAGPMFGISTPENPTVDMQGNVITQEMIDAVYAGFLGGLIFDREVFMERLASLLDPLTPDPEALGPPPAEGEVDARNAVMEELVATPDLFYATDLPDPQAPEGFVVDVPASVPAPLEAAPLDLTGLVPTSPFNAAPGDAWLDPEFRLALPNLLAFLEGLTDLPAQDLLHELGILAQTGGEVVATVEGTLADFPAFAPVLGIEPLAVSVQGAMTRLPAPLPIKLGVVTPVGGELPPEAEAAMEAAAVLAASAQYAATVNGVQVNGTWDAPMPVDVNADGVADAILSLQLAPSAEGLPEPAVATAPLFTLDRVDASEVVPTIGATVRDARNGGAQNAAPPSVPTSALAGLDLVVAYRMPNTVTTVVYVVTVEEGLDHFEVRLASLTPSVDVKTVGGLGAFAFAVGVLQGDTLDAATLTSPQPPTQILFGGEVDTATGAADLHATPLAPMTMSVAALEATPGARLAVAAGGADLAGFEATTRGADFALATTAGGALTLARHESVGASTSDFTARVLTLADAPAEFEATLLASGVTFEAPTAGATVTALVADVAAGQFVNGAWVEVSGAGKRGGVDFTDGVAFTSDREVEGIRAVRAEGAAFAFSGPVPVGTLVAWDDIIAFSLDDTRSATVRPTATGYSIDVAGSAPGQFLMDARRLGGAEIHQYLMSNLPRQASIDIGANGFSLGTSDLVGSIAGYVFEPAPARGLNPTHTAMALQNVKGTAAISMADASMNAFVTGAAGAVDVVSSNVIGPRGPVFQRLPGAHTLAQVNGAAAQHSASLANAVGSITGNLAGPLATVSIKLNIQGGFCQSFGKGTTQVVFCLSNVPSQIDLTLQALPNPTLTYDATAIINQLSLQVLATDVDVTFAIQQIPKHIQLALQAGGMTLSTDTRLGAILLNAELGTTTLSAAVQDLPKTLSFTWGSGGVTPSMPAGDAIGRAYVFLSRPGLAFLLDLVHLPPSTITWSANSFSAGPVGDRITSATVQLAVSDLQMLLQATQVPGVSASWSTTGGTLGTNGPLGGISLSLTKGPWWSPQLRLVAALSGVPQLTSTWSTNAMGLNLASGKIASLDFTFQAGDLLLDLDADGIPTTTLTMSGAGFTLAAPGALDSITLVLAKGSGYYDPNRGTDFVGLYLRPDLARFGISARFTGIKQVSYSKSDAARSQAITLGFTTDKSVQLLADLDSSVLKAYADVMLTNLAATTTININPDGVSLSGTPLNPARPQPWIQAFVGAGTPNAYLQTPDPRWPWQTSGDWRGVMGNTMVDTTVPGVNVATKWKVYAPLPNVISVSKVTTNGIPSSVGVTTGVSLGKLDLRTNLKVNLNVCSGCTPLYLNTLAVAAVSNLPTSLTLTQGLGSGSGAGSPSFNIASAQSIQDVFLGVRFDNQWYATAGSTGGFPVWGSVSQIPTSVGLTISKNGGWNAGNLPQIGYSANANTLDARFYLDIGYLWTQFAKPTINNAAAVGRPVPGWLLGLAQMDAKGHLFLELVDLPASGVAIYKSGDAIVVDPLGSAPLTKFFGDFNLRLERNWANSGCWVCGVIQLDWWYSFGYFFEINQLSLLLENLRYVSLNPGIESIIVLDGHLVFHFRASVGINFSAGIRLTVNILGASWELVCICLPPISLSAMVDPGFMTFQVNTYTFSVNYFTLGFFCHFFEPWYEPWAHAWCETHYYAGVTYTIPTNWQWDLPIAYPPVVPFRGLNLYSGTHHVIMNPRMLNCVNDFCWEVGRLIPPSLVMAYAYLKYTSISGVQWWDTYHEHWF